MAKLVPVNYDPFAKPKGGARLVAVDYDPFAKPKISEDLKRRQAEIEAEIKRRQAQIEEDKRKAEAARAAPKSFFELLTRGVTGGEAEEAGVRDDAKAFEARAAANKQAIEALSRERQFIQEQGRAVPKLTTTGRIREAAKALPAQAIRSTSQFAGSAGVIPGVGEEFARRMEQRGEDVVKSLGLQESEEVQFDPLQQAISGVTGGIGSLLPYVGTELAGRGLGRGLRAVEAARAADIALKTSRGAQAALGAGQGAAQQRQQIEEFERETGQTVSPLRRSASQFGGLVIGLSEALPIPGMAQTGVARIAAEGLTNRIVKSAIEEGAQEGGSQLVQNVIEATGYNPEKVRNLGEGVLENAVLGSITGGIVSAGTGGTQALFERGKPAPSGNVPPPPPGAEAEPLRTTTVTYPNREDPTNPITRTLDVLSEPDTDGYITVRDETGKAFEMKAADLEELEIASPAYQAPPETEAPPSAPTVDRATITERMRVASGTPEGAKPAGRVVSLANDVASALEAEDPVAAQAAIQSRMNALAASRMSETTKAQRQAEIDEAQSIVNDYRVEFARARAAAPARIEAPAVEPSSIEQALEQNAALAAEDEARAAEERAQLERESALESASLIGQGSPIRQAQTERQQLFDTIINDETVENPAAAFRQALAERGYPNTELNEAERRQIQARLAFEQAPIVEEEPVAGEPTEVPAPPSAAPPEVVAGAAEPVVEEEGVAPVPTAAPTVVTAPPSAPAAAPTAPPAGAPVKLTPYENVAMSIVYYPSGAEYSYIGAKEPEWGPVARDRDRTLELYSPGYDYDKARAVLGRKDIDAVEVKNVILPNGEKATTVSVLVPSVDETLGDRGNHTGVTFWFRGVYPADLASTIETAQTVAKWIANPNNSKKSNGPLNSIGNQALEYVANLGGQRPAGSTAYNPSFLSAPNTVVAPDIAAAAADIQNRLDAGETHIQVALSEEPGVAAVPLGEEPTPSAMVGELAGAPVTAQEAADYDARKALREDARNKLREVLKGFGFDNITVIVRDLLEGGKFAGSYDPMDSIIRVAMNPDGTVMESVLYHELVHYLKDHGFFSDAEWNAILKFAKRDLVMRGIIEYAYRGETRANKDEEIVAEAFRAWMAESAEGFQKKNTVFAKVRRFLNAIRDFFFDQNLNDANAVFEAIRNGEFATREDKGSAKRAAYFAGTAEMPGRRPIYAGLSITRARVLGGAEEAKLIRADFEAAQRMEEAGESPETIRVATGWERNPYDNEWRYLQPDNLASQKPLLDQLIADFDFAKDLNEMAFNPDGSIELQDIMNHPELYQIYPDARSIRVFVKKSKKSDGLQGSFNPENKTISLYTGAQDPLGTLLHEVQHWVQDKEGFPTGSSPETVWDKLSDEQKVDEAALVVAGKRIEAKTYRDAASVVSWLRQNIRGNIGKNPTPDQIESLLEPYGQENPAISGESIDAAINAILGFNEQRVAFGADPLDIGRNTLLSIESELESEANDQESMAETILGGGVTIEGSPAEKIVRDDFEGNILMSRSELRYRDTAGEIEARDVTQQMRKTREELRAAGTLASERPRKPEDVVISRRAEGPSASAAPNPTVPPNTTKGAKLGFITNMRNFMSDLYRKHMYKYSGALKLDEKLANALGVKKLPKEMSLEDRASMFETMRSGLLRDFKRMWFDPFKRAIKASGIDPQDLSMYLWARSAADRNALIAERNRDMPDGGSGLTNLEAEAILAYYKASGLMRKMEPLIKQHDQLVDWMLKQRVKNGLMSKAEADLLRKQQPFYTPLKGFAADGDMFTAGDEDPHTDYKGPSQLGVRPQDYIKTEGRASMPFDPVSNLISDAMYLTQRIARNDVGKRFVSIVQDFPDLLGDAVKIYTDDKPKIVSKGIAPPGSTKKTVGPMNMAANAKKFIVVKIDGKNYYVELNEKKSDGAMLKRMFENMTPKDLDGLVKVLAKLGNLKKQMLTRFNPPFWVWNFGTDVYDAIVTAISEKTREGSPVQGKDVALRFMGNLVKPSTWTAVGRYITGRDPTDAKAAENVLLLSQMVQDGGEAGRQYVMKAEEVADEIKRDAAIIKSGGVKNIWGKANEKRRALVRVVDGINEFLGLVPRFAAYKAAIDAGVEADDAAKFALDSTLNLSRKGEATDAVDNIYLFTNPAAQSLEKKTRIYKSKYGRRALASMMTLGVGLHFFNMMMAGDDDDDGENDYQELDEATKLKNLIIYTGDGEPIKMPVGFLVAFEVYLGQQLARMITNDSSGIGVMQAAANAWNGFFSSQLPAGDKIGSFGDIPKIAIPDVFTFGVDLYRNKNYFDGQIYPEPYYEGQAVSGMPRESTGEFYKKFAAAVNRWGGGTEDVASDFDTPAEAWQYAVNQNLLVGGAGIPRDFFKAYEEADVTKLPIVKRFVGDSSEYAAQNKYFDRIQKIEVIAGQKEGENKNSDAYAESKEKFPVEADSKVIKAYKDSEKQLRKLNKDAREARKNGGPNMQSKLDKIKQDRNEVYVKFNRKYNEVKQGL